jgi:hypothetical protein
MPLSETRIKLFLWFTLSCLSIIVFILIDREALPDYSSYIQLSGNIGLNEAAFIEPIPYFLIYINNLLLPDDVFLSIPYLFIFYFFLIVYYKFVNLRHVSSFGMLLFYLSFFFIFSLILLRASPAYLIITLSILTACQKDGNRVSVVLPAFSVLFHVSAAVPLLLFYISRINFLQTKKVYLTLILIAAIWLALSVFSTFSSDIFTEVVELLNMSKYKVYFVQNVPKYAFFVYFFLLLLFVLAFSLLYKGEEFVILFASLSILVIAILSSYSVLAFRFSIYLLAPILLIFPWKVIPSYLKVLVLFVITAKFIHSFDLYVFP